MFQSHRSKLVEIFGPPPEPQVPLAHAIILIAAMLGGAIIFCFLL